MSQVSLLEKLIAISRRDILTAVRYRNGFLLGLIGTFAEMFTFFYLARAIGPAFRPEGVAFFPFLVVGIGFYSFLISGVQAFLSTVQEAQQTGTIEVLLTTSTPAPVLIFLSAFSAFAGKTAKLAFDLVVGLILFQVALPHPNFGATLAIFLLSLAVAIAMGVLAAAVQIAIQKGSAVIWLLSSVGFLTGTLFPVHILPIPLQWAAWLIPITHSLSGMRGALLLGQSTSQLAPEILWLGVAAFLLLPTSLFILSWVLRRGRREGTLSFY